MNRGKQICKALKELRKRIADANGIPFEIEECTYDGPCRGTCPKCEQELSYLTAALHDKESRGEPVNIDDIVTEDDLRSLYMLPKDNVWDNLDDIPARTPGIIAPPDDEMKRNRLELELTASVEECLNLVNEYPNVAIYIDPFDRTTLVVKRPGTETEALFGFDYCDWRQLVKNNLPDEDAIVDYVSHRIDFEDSQDDDEWSLEGDIAAPPLYGEVGIQKCNSNRLLADALMNLLLSTVDKQNIVFSPIGVASILTMLLHATEDKSLIYERIHSLLDGFKIEEFDKCGLDGITLEHATSMWYNRSLGLVNENYVAQIRRMFGTEPHAVDFDNAEAVKALVDKWASRHTNGMVKQVDVQTSRDTLMLILDALYMKAAWEVPFDEDGTSHRTFHNADGTTSRVDMMHLRTHDAEYERTNDYQVVNLQYSGFDVFMTIILPRKGIDLEAVMRQRNWLEVDPEDDYDIDLRMPRFKFDCKVELNDTLKALGLAELFDTETAMPKMTDEPAHVSRVFQQCAISVTEQGTEASSVTVAEMVVGCLPPEEKPKYHRMIVDRPFGFAIQDVNHNILFMGIVNHFDDIAPQQPTTPPRSGKYITSVTVAGTSHVKNMEALSENITEGTELLLKHEPDNRFDRNAIGIYLGVERVGYVPRKSNQILANLLDAGVELFAVVTATEWRGNWLDIQANILMPQ